jgi:radical SAM superfamily enzyme YgiQ (UPF0313 family)
MKDSSILDVWFFMLGSGDKYDKESYILKNIKFIKNTGCDLVQLTILTPFPGTPLYYKLKKEGRISEDDWSKWDGIHCVYEPIGIKKEKLEKFLYMAYRDIYLDRPITRNVKLIFKAVDSKLLKLWGLIRYLPPLMFKTLVS